MHYDVSFRTADNLVRTVAKTGVTALDRLLAGGYEYGLIHLFYGHLSFYEDLMRAAVWAQVPEKRGGLESPVIIIDSSNMINTLKLADYASEYDLDIEDVMDNIFISRAFSSSQTYDLILNHLDKLLERVPAKLLIAPGLSDLFTSEGFDVQRAQQLTHAAASLMAKTLEHELITLISTKYSQAQRDLQSVSRALASIAQVHILLEQTPMRTLYTLTKHPSLPVHSEYRVRYNARFGVTLPLEFFFEGGFST
jgi:RecA/RadA recombinase